MGLKAGNKIISLHNVIFIYFNEEFESYLAIKIFIFSLCLLLKYILVKYFEFKLNI